MDKWATVNWKFLSLHKFNILIGCFLGFISAFVVLSFVPPHFQATALVQLPQGGAESPLVVAQRLGAPSLLNEVERRAGISGLAQTMLAPIYGGEDHLSASMVAGSANVLQLHYWNTDQSIARRGLTCVVDVLLEHENELQAESVKFATATLAELQKKVIRDEADQEALKTSADSHAQRMLFFDTVISHDLDQIQAVKNSLLSLDEGKARLLEDVSVSVRPVFPRVLHKLALGCVLSLFLSCGLIYIRRKG